MVDQLRYFPELMETYEVFKMKPLSGGGYSERYDKRKTEGYWSWRRQSKFDEQGGLRTENYQATFWVKSYFITKKIVIEENDYVEVDGKLFVVVDHQDFTREGGFHKCLMQRLEGPTDQQVTNRRVDGAIAADY